MKLAPGRARPEALSRPGLFYLQISPGAAHSLMASLSASAMHGGIALTWANL